MKIFVLPVSGGGFPIQISYLNKLSYHNQEGDIYLTSSGGSVATYLALAGNFRNSAIIKVLSDMDNSKFVSSWTKGIPSIIQGYFKGSVYRRGEGADRIFKNYFNDERICNIEIWSGTVNRATGKARFFCNKKREDSLIKNKDFRPFIKSMPLEYLNGDVVNCVKTCLASASIPGLVEEQIFEDEEHVDGGVFMASPLSAFQSNLENEEEIHIYYLSSFDLENCNYPKSYKNLYEHSKISLYEIMRSMASYDRYMAIMMLGKEKDIIIMEYEGTDENLRKIIEHSKGYKRTLIELYPTDDMSINIINFTNRTIMRSYEEAKTRYNIRYWYNKEICCQSLEVSHQYNKWCIN